VLISPAHGAGLLSAIFGRKEVRTRKQRIERVVKGEMTGRAAKEVIAACQTAVMVSCMMPAIMSGAGR
jgi:hypothetical protein